MVTSKKPLSHDSRMEVNYRFNFSLAPLNNMSYKGERWRLRPFAPETDEGAPRMRWKRP